MKKTVKKNKDFIFNFYNIKLDIFIDPTVYSESDIEYITYIVSILSRDIYIDKTYVLYENTKYTKTFMYEYGWNELCEIIQINKNRKKITKYENELLYGIYEQMIAQYILLCLSCDFDYDVSCIDIKIQPKTKINMRCIPDTYCEWEKYPGKWQTWQQ